ncbi:hypothetical protein [Stieleria sp.]|uniref:hypothetical protein n=1 Tax=Stieleria sp. TaxID=2795976 RepID=UPI00356555A7
MARLFFLCMACALCQAGLVANDRSRGKIVVDASQGGGTWWHPQAETFDSNAPHQGKRLADTLRRAGWEVVEIARNTVVTDQLAGAKIAIRVNASGLYQESEVVAYRDFVLNGGSVLLVRGFVRENRSEDKVANEFGIKFSKVVRAETFSHWEDHPITENLRLSRYRIGSVVVEAPEESIPLGYVNNNELALGLLEWGSGKVIYMSTISPLIVSDPIVHRIIKELASD